MTKTIHYAHSDEILLTMLRLRDRGLSSSQIGLRVGLSRNTVIGALTRIDRDDLDREAAQ